MSSESEHERESIISSRKRALQIKKRKPKFRRQESWRYLKLRRSSWRKPKGIDNKMRLSFKGWPPLVRIGYGSPKAIRGLHPSGLRPIIVSSLKDLKKLEGSEGVIVVISAKIGGRLKRSITEEAKSMGIRVSNPYTTLSTEGKGA